MSSHTLVVIVNVVSSAFLLAIDGPSWLSLMSVSGTCALIGLHVGRSLTVEKGRAA